MAVSAPARPARVRTSTEVVIRPEPLGGTITYRSGGVSMTTSTGYKVVRLDGRTTGCGLWANRTLAAEHARGRGWRVVDVDATAAFPWPSGRWSGRFPAPRETLTTPEALRRYMAVTGLVQRSVSIAIDPTAGEVGAEWNLVYTGPRGAREFPLCHWPDCHREATGPFSFYCVAHDVPERDHTTFRIPPRTMDPSSVATRGTPTGPAARGGYR